MDIHVGDVLELKKEHPCGSRRWLVLRVGMDFKLRCEGCGHELMLPRSKAEKSIKRVLRTEEHYVDICLTPGEHRGQTVVDWEDRLGRPANVQVGVAADPQRFWQLVSAAVKGTL